MTESRTALAYLDRSSPVHNLTGASKLIVLLLWSIAAMFTYDTRVLVGLFFLSIGMFFLSKIRLKEISGTLTFIIIFLLLNNIAIFLFSPEQGVEIYGTRHEIIPLFMGYVLTQEQLFYLLNISLKYFVVTPVALLFLLTTNPSEFAASLNRIGVSYRIGWSVSIALRYIPDIRRDYRTIAQAQQARGVKLSKKAKPGTRLKNTAAILLPLILSSLHRIEVISNAMELRGFGRYRKRTWYSRRPFRAGDFAAVTFAAAVAIISLLITFYDGSRYYNPFLQF